MRLEFSLSFTISLSHDVIVFLWVRHFTFNIVDVGKIARPIHQTPGNRAVKQIIENKLVAKFCKQWLEIHVLSKYC